MNKELERFKTKAHGYREAHEYAGDIRCLELASVAAIIEGHRRRLGKSRRNLRILDVMAGTGFLAKTLADMGLLNVVALEASAEMSTDGRTNLENRFRKESFLTDIELIECIRRESPDVVICFAGYHHLHGYKNPSETCPDFELSVRRQLEFTELVMNNIPAHCIFCIVDIYDASIASKLTSDLKPFCVSGSIEKYIRSNHGCAKGELNGSSFNRFCSISQEFCNDSFEKNPALVWFREFVDLYSVEGHKDSALSSKFFEGLSAKSYDYQLRVASVPWIHTSEEAIRTFVKKLWFLNVKSEFLESWSSVFETKEAKGWLRKRHNVTVFPWSLAYCVIKKPAFNDAVSSLGLLRRLKCFFMLHICFVTFLLFIKVTAIPSNELQIFLNTFNGVLYGAILNVSLSLLGKE